MKALGCVLIAMVLSQASFAADKTKGAETSHLSSAEKTQLQKWQKYLDDPKGAYAYYPKEMCGRNIPVKLEETIVQPFMKAGNDAAVYCESFRTKLSTMCRNSAGAGTGNKEKINKMIDRVVCQGNTTEDGLAFELKGKDLVVSLGAKSSNLEEGLLSFIDSK